MIIPFKKASGLIRQVPDEALAGRLRSHVSYLVIHEISRESVADMPLLSPLDPKKTRQFLLSFLTGCAKYGGPADLSGVLESLLHAPTFEASRRQMLPVSETDPGWYEELCHTYPYGGTASPDAVFCLMRACAACVRFLD